VLVGADAEPVAAVLAQPDRQPPDRAGDVLGAGGGTAAGDVHVPGLAVVPGDVRLHRIGDQQRVQLVDGVGVAAAGTELEHPSQPLAGAPHGDQVALAGLLCGPGVRTEGDRRIDRVVGREVRQCDRRLRVRVEVHGPTLDKIAVRNQPAGHRTGIPHTRP
jgi:hypothetical protein